MWLWLGLAGLASLLGQVIAKLPLLASTDLRPCASLSLQTCRRAQRGDGHTMQEDPKCCAECVLLPRLILPARDAAVDAGSGRQLPSDCAPRAASQQTCSQVARLPPFLEVPISQRSDFTERRQ